MAGVAIKTFRGRVPRISTRLLDDSHAQIASDCVITNGKLVPLNRPALVHTSLAASIGSLFRYKFGAERNWLVWPGTVDVALSSTAQDSLGRFYFTGDGEPRMSTYADAISGGGPYPAAWYVLGVAPPKTAPSLAVVGGSAPTEARAYVYTFVTRYGEQSGPSPAVLVTGNVDGSWNLSNMDAAPPNSGTVTGAVKDTPAFGQVEVTLNSVFGLMAGETVDLAAVAGMTDLNGVRKIVSVNQATNKIVVTLSTAQTYTSGGTWARKAPHNTTGMVKRIYRTGGTSADYRLVAEIPVATTTYNDTVAATALGEICPTLNTLPPPKELHSIIALANGAHAGLAGNELCMSEPYKPYSWPLANRYSIPANGVALSAVLNSVIVLTDGFPYIATATVPEAASLAPSGTFAPCVSKRGVVQKGDGCMYPSLDGLYAINAGGAVNATMNLAKKKEWKALMPETFRAAYSSMGYYAVHGSAMGADSIVFLDAAEPDGLIDYSEPATAIYANPDDTDLYLAIGNKVYRWDSDTANRKTMYWRSKEFEMPYPMNFAAIQVKGDFKAIVPLSTEDLEYNQALMSDLDAVGGDIASTELLTFEVASSGLRTLNLQTEGKAQYTLLKNGEPIFTKLVTSNNPFRGPAGFTSDIYAHEIASNIRIDSICAAESMEELGQV